MKFICLIFDIKKKIIYKKLYNEYIKISKNINK